MWTIIRISLSSDKTNDHDLLHLKGEAELRITCDTTKAYHSKLLNGQ